MDLDSRPIGDVQVCLGMGLNVERRSLATTEMELERRRAEDFQQATADLLNPLRRRSTGFRVSLRQAFFSWIRRYDRRSRSDSEISSSSGRPSSSQFQPTSSRPDSGINSTGPATPRIEISDYSDLEHEPRSPSSGRNHTPSSESDAEEVRLPDGIAVTEEGVDSGLSDIITQV